ncbi:conserved hypothetical protein [Frankia sp. Hr75.2]|nr:conserved hypothetical protein [Frankia sp. Hr75.2]
MASDGSKDQVPDGAASTAGPYGQSCVEIEQGIVDLLDLAPTLAAETSRRLLVSRTERRLGVQLQVPDAPYRRQWFIGFVDACCAHPKGPRALAQALCVLEPASVTARSVQNLVDCWETARSAAGPTAGNGHGSPARAPSHRAEALSGGDLTPGRDDEALTGQECAALAAAFHTAVAQRQVLTDAGLPIDKQPNPDGLTSEEFWREVSRLLADGILTDGRRRVLTEAHRRFPGNRFLRNGRP